ncbi:MAG TPA: sulfotransferase [Candidatus Binataceae bacterium]|nr:sulfotransferase [Candidatus Binataceae bacterium]
MSTGAWSRPVFNLNAAAWGGIRARNREPIDRGLALRFYLAGGALSALGILQRRLYGSVVDQTALKPPIFLVGHWRSGTTLLHELLALDGKFAAPSTYECFNPHHFLFAPYRPPDEKLVLRPTGDMTVSPASPQEEEFALLCMGAISPYEAFLFPRALERFEALCDPDLFDGAQQLRWNDAMTWILKATAYVRGADKPLLLKSPANSFRIRRLGALFPGAAFIRTVREPCAVFASTLRLWQSMWQRYALTAPLAQEALIERILETRRALEQKLRSAAAFLPAGRYVTVRYEDLVSDPCATIELLYDRMALGDPSALLPKVRAYLAERPRPPAQSADQWRPLVQARWPEMFDEFSYPRR